ncbi:MAG: ABC transporter permease [Thermoplasmata archaeon]
MARLTRFLVHRGIQALITVFVVTSLVFVLFEAMPGDPLTKFRLDPRITPDVIQRLEERFGLDQPLYVRYFLFMRNMFTFDFGRSFQFNRDIGVILQEAVPRTLFLFGMATIITYLLGAIIGSLIAWKRGGLREGGTVVASLFFYNMPSFWIGLIFIWVFSFAMGWFPLAGFARPEETCEFFTFTCNNPPLLFILDWLWHATLPLTVLVLISAAGVILLMRTSLLEVMGEDYILTAKAKGLREKVVRKKHANRNAYLPIVTSFTIAFAFAIGGAIILERIFTYQGVGYMYLEALFNQDHFLAGATLFIIALLVIIGNVIADIMYAVLDPRVRL